MKFAEMTKNWDAVSFEENQEIADVLGISLPDACAWADGADSDESDRDRADAAFIKFAVKHGESEDGATFLLENFEAIDFIYEKMDR